MTTVPVTFISGPYRSKWGYLGRWLNKRRAVKEAKKWIVTGSPTIIPHTNSWNFPESMANFVHQYLLILDRCDQVVVLQGWKKSEGTCAEVERARNAKKKLMFCQKDGSYIIEEGQIQDIFVGEAKSVRAEHEMPRSSQQQAPRQPDYERAARYEREEEAFEEKLERAKSAAKKNSSVGRKQVGSRLLKGKETRRLELPDGRK